MASIIAGSEIVWLPKRPCPSWCASGDHTRSPVAEDRAHWGHFAEMELLMHPRVPLIDGTTTTDRVMTVLEHGEKEHRPKVRQITSAGMDQLVLTLGEAEHLGRTLLGLVAEARLGLSMR